MRVVKLRLYAAAEVWCLRVEKYKYQALVRMLNIFSLKNASIIVGFIIVSVFCAFSFLLSRLFICQTN